MAWIRHDSRGEAVIKNQQALGPESPLKTDEDGYAEVHDDEAAELLAAIDSHVELASPPPESDEDGESDASADASEDTSDGSDEDEAGDEAATCEHIAESTGEECGRELPCQYHSDDEE